MKKIFLLFSILLSSAAFSQVVNDECSGALMLTPSPNCPSTDGTLQSATTSTIPAGCTGYKEYNDVFYKFTATGTAATVTVTPSSGLDVMISFFSDCGTSSFFCVDDYYAGAYESGTATGLVIGRVYFIKVGSYSPTPSTNTFSICIQAPSPIIRPLNDECSGAIAITTSCTPTGGADGTLENATTSSTSLSCSGSRDVFYKFTAKSTKATVTVMPSSELDVILSVFSDCNSLYNFSDCEDAYFKGHAEYAILTDLTIGNVYLLKVASYDKTSSTNTFSICVHNENPPPVNEECSGAISLIQKASCTTTKGTLENATESAITTGCFSSSGYPDVFYKFIATNSSATITLLPSYDIDLMLSVYSNCEASTTLYCYNNAYESEAEIASIYGLQIGYQYYIKVSLRDLNPLYTGDYTFDICVSSLTTGTQEAVYLNSINLFPNPVQNTLHFSNISNETAIEILNVNGTSLLKKTLSDDNSIDLSELISGIYIVQLSLNDVTENRRIIVTK